MDSLKLNFKLINTSGLVFSLLILIAIAPSTYAIENENFRYGIGGNNKIFTDLGEALTGGSFQLAIKDGVPATILLDLVDIYADESGTKQPLPVDSNPFTAMGLVEFPKIAGQYVPNGEFQNIDIPFRFKNIADINRPVLGGLRISIATQVEQTDQIKVSSSIVATFGYYPVGTSSQLGDALTPKLEIGKLKFTQLLKDMIPFNFIPNLPRFYNSSPLNAQFDIKNTGNIFLTSNTRLVVEEPPIFGIGSSIELLSTDKQELLLIPNQVGTLAFNLIGATQPGAQLEDVFPGVGIYKVVITTTGSLGSNELVTETKSSWIVIFPWKYILGILILLALLWWPLRSKFKIVKSGASASFSNQHQDLAVVNSFNQEFERIMAESQIKDASPKP